MKSEEIKKGALADLRIESLAFGGRGIARVDGLVVFVEQALPGDMVRARITRRKTQYAEAQMTELLEPSADRVEAPCPVFGVCGGCKMQNYAYTEQLRHKQQHVADALEHIARQQNFNMHPIVPSPDPWHYRNKMEYAFGTDADGRIEIGFHRAGDYRRIVEVKQCAIQPELLDEVLAHLSGEINACAGGEKSRLVPYNKDTHEGFLRHLVLRISRTTGEFLVAILTGAGEWKALPGIAERFVRRFSACRGFLWGVNRSVSDVARMEEKRFQSGDGWIEESLGGKKFRISAFSFFQTNTLGAKALYDTVKDFCELTGGEQVLDAYCGTGSIGIYVSDAAARVVGVELVREAVWDARFNARENGADNCTFLAGEMREVLPMLGQTVGGRFDRLIVDPPRGGMDKKSLRQLIGIRAPLLVYVSCNPATLARDAVTLTEAGYTVEDVQAVDMFPHTYHVESVIKFRRKAS